MPASSSSKPHHSRARTLRTTSQTVSQDGATAMKPQQECCKKAAPSSNGHAEQPETAVIRYTECRKNHAARIGGYAVDGCREFMAEGEEGTAAALRCAACGCHRSFHRREVVERVPRAPWEWDCSSNSGSPR